MHHKKMPELNNRPFKDLKEHDEVLIQHFNSIVTTEDTTYFIGDIVMGDDKYYAETLLRRLNGKKYLIKGNHDKKWKDYGIFEDIKNIMEIKIDHRILVLCHYPLLSWHHRGSGAIMLHGHIHSTGEYNKWHIENNIARYDVGVDANNYYPVKIQDIISKFPVKDKTADLILETKAIIELGNSVE